MFFPPEKRVGIILLINFKHRSSILIAAAHSFWPETVLRAAGRRTGAAVRQETVLRLVGRQLGAAGRHGRRGRCQRDAAEDGSAAGGRRRQALVHETDRLVQRHRVPRAPSGRPVRPVPGFDVHHGADHVVE